MAVTMKCADLGGDCVGEFTTEGVDELMDHVAMHASKVHPDLELTPELVEKAKTLIRTD
jgi:predicted small metal-binding protein